MADLRVQVNSLFRWGNAQEGVWLLDISLPHLRRTRPSAGVQWPSRARDACAKKPVPRARRDLLQKHSGPKMR